MIRKQLFLLLCCMGCLSAFSLQVVAHFHGYATEQANEVDPIDLKGDLEKGKGLRSATEPIVAEKQGNAIYVRFQQEVGMLHITVTGTQGQVYYTTANTDVQTALIIPTVGLPAGSYTITFSNERGTMWGEFEI